MTTTATAHAKFILSGEHFVVDGTHSVVIPANCFYTTVTLSEHSQPNPEVECIFECEDPPRDVTPYKERILSLLLKAFEILNIHKSWLTGLKCEVKTNIPPGQGAGSSSALCQAMMEALIKKFIYKPVHPNYLWWFGMQLENTFHGPVSGIDNAVIAYQKILYYQREEKPIVLYPTKPLDFVVGTTGPRRNDVSPYEIIKELKEKHPIEYNRYKSDMDLTASRMVAAICDKHPVSYLLAIGEQMFESFKILQDIGLVPDDVKPALQAALKLAVPSVRMTGAGGGGFLISLVENDSERDTLIKAWKKLGLKSVNHIHL